MLILLILASFLLFPFSSFSQSDLVTATAYLLVEKDSFEIIEGRNFHMRLPPASTTKVVTALIALDRLKEDEIIIPKKGVLSVPASKMGLIPGKKYRAQDLIYGMLVKSANDAAYAIACHIAGTEEAFADLMNSYVRSIGARDTNFKNASGLYHPQQYTTCYDLALIMRHALDNANLRQILSSRYFDFKSEKRILRFQNHNRFLFCFEPSICGKTGFTRASRHTYVGAFEKGGRIYILSILGSEDLWGDSLCILRNLYDRLPDLEELRNARARDILLASFTPKKPESKNAVKKISARKKRSHRR